MTNTSKTTVCVGITLALEPQAAFDIITGELSSALAQAGIVFEPAPNGGVRQGSFEVGRVVAWQPGELFRMQWRPADWAPQEVAEAELRCQAVGAGTQVTLEQRGWGGLVGGPDELAGWFAGQIAAPLLQATAPAAFGDWVTDRRARRPSGARARATYREPLYHFPNFRVLLQELALTPQDYLLEVGCGGGAFLKLVLQSGCRAAAIDHSPDMLAVARELNSEAVSAGRLELRHAAADSLPFPDETFSCAVMTGVLGFLPDPLTAFQEIRRALHPGGRFLALGSDPALKGTPAAPEPIASRLRFYRDDQLEALAREAGFEEVRVVRRSVEQFARESGIPAEHLALFTGPGPGFLIARRGLAHRE